MEQLVQEYIELNGVTFELRAINEDGEVLLKETSSLSFDDVADSAWQLDSAFLKLVQEANESRNDDLVDAEVNSTLDERSY